MQALALSMLMSSLGVSITNVALPTLAKDFHVSIVAVQWLITAYLLSATVTIVGIGHVGDKMGRRRLLRLGVLVYTLAAVSCAIAPGLEVIILARAIQGFGAAALMALSVALIGENVEKEKIGSAMGVMATMSALGTTLGPALGGTLIDLAGWRSIFVFMAVVGLFNLILVTRLRSKNNELKPTNKFSMHILGNRVLSTSLAMNALVSSVMMTTLVVGPFYLSRSLELAPWKVGMTMTLGPLCSVFSGLPAGRLVDRFGIFIITLTGLIAMGIGMAALVFLPRYFGLIGYIVSVMILSPGYQLFQAANGTSIMSNAKERERGLISGLMSLSRNLGLIIGAGIMGAIFNRTGMELTFTVAFFLVIAAIGLLILIYPKISSISKTTAPGPLK